MPKRPLPSYLRLVEHARQPQATILPCGMGRPVLAFLDVSRTSEELFSHTLSSLRPRWIFDLRPVPNFDIGRLSRRKVFEIFENMRVSYRDVSGVLKILAENDASLNSGAVAKVLNDAFATDSEFSDVLVLLDSNDWLNRSVKLLPKTLRSPTQWDVRVLSN